MSAISGKRVLVTGAGGFIGSNLVELLVAEGAQVRAYVHYNSRNDWAHLEELPADVRDAIDVVAGEIQDPFSVRRAMEGRDVVFHLAALIGIPYSYVAPQSYVATNVTGTLNVLEAGRDLGVERIVHTSTSETYGTAIYTPIDERHPLQGDALRFNMRRRALRVDVKDKACSMNSTFLFRTHNGVMPAQGLNGKVEDHENRRRRINVTCTEWVQLS